MSLINRMLGDLAARQAPGTNTLDGVRLNEPLAKASANLSMRTALLTIGIAVGIAALIGWLWPRASVPVPQPRGVSTARDAAPVANDPAPLAEASAAESAIAPLGFASTGGAPVTPTLAFANGMSLRLDASLVLPDSAMQDAATRRPASRPRTSPETRSAAQADAETPPARSERARTSITRDASADPADKADVDPVAATSGLLSAADFAARKREARDAIARGESTIALGLLDAATSEADAEALSLRAAALQRLGRHEEAAGTYGRLTASEAAVAGHWVGLGISLEGLDRGDEARSAYRRALETPGLAAPLRRFSQQRLAAPEAQ